MELRKSMVEFKQMMIEQSQSSNLYYRWRMNQRNISGVKSYELHFSPM